MVAAPTTTALHPSTGRPAQARVMPLPTSSAENTSRGKNAARCPGSIEAPSSSRKKICSPVSTLRRRLSHSTARAPAVRNQLNLAIHHDGVLTSSPRYHSGSAAKVGR